MQVGRGWRNDSCSHPQSLRSKPTRDGMRAAAEHWRGWQNTFRPVITAPCQESIKREEDPPRWHLESLHAAALMNQTVSGLNMPVFWRLPSMLQMSKIIEALCKEKDFQQIWSATRIVTLPGVAPAKQLQDQRKWICFPTRPTYAEKGSYSPNATRNQSESVNTVCSSKPRCMSRVHCRATHLLVSKKRQICQQVTR